jgi:phosphoglycolate phosphatase-like HAD superfamily hydrolase/ADP-ribose pyrophosphatase YjhB (NUDIX family)
LRAALLDASALGGPAGKVAGTGKAATLGEMIRNVIFDWSGTLVDDLPAVLKATNYVLAQSQRPEMTLEQFRSEFCLPFTRFYDRHVPHVPLPQLETWFHSRFREVQDSVCELPHAREFLDFCRARGLRTFLLSTVHKDHFAVQSGVTGFDKYLDRLYINVWDKREKIHEILEENHLAPDETVFIGDMQHDVETAKHGGIHSCAVLTGYNTLSQLRAAGPDLIVEHLKELREILEQNDLHLQPQGKRLEQKRPPIVTVGALIFDGSGNVLMVRTHKWSDLWGIPGGKIKWGETSEDALRREIKEETDLEITDIEFALVQDCIHSKEFYRDAHFVLLNYTCRCAGRPAVRLNEEAREFQWMSPAQALAMPINQPTRKLLDVVTAGMAEAATQTSECRNVQPLKD